MINRIGTSSGLSEMPENASLETAIDYILDHTDADSDNQLKEAFKMAEEYAKDRGPDAVRSLKLAIAKKLTSSRTDEHRVRAYEAGVQFAAIDERRRLIDNVVEGKYGEMIARDSRDANSIEADYKVLSDK